MTTRLAGWVLVGMALAACSNRAPRDAATVAPHDLAPVTTDVPTDVGAAEDVPHTTHGDGASGPWSAEGAGAFAVSNAIWLRDGVYSAVAVPTEDLRRAELRWLRWRASGPEVVARKDVSGMIPGATLSLTHRDGGGATVVWVSALAQGDAGLTPRAQDVNSMAFTGDERAATSPGETAGATWIQGVTARRVRTGADEVAPDSTREGVTVHVEPRGQGAVVSLDGTQITRGPDLLGYERAVGGAARGDVRWVALSRGRCADARIEVYRVERGAATLRASFPIGDEIGVRWIALDPQDDHTLAVSWYQDFIPIRIACGAHHTLSRVDQHGIRVALIRGP